jgi:hypothetical protein
MSLYRMLMGSLVLTLRMVRFCVVCHRSLHEESFAAPETLRRLLAKKYPRRIKISHKFARRNVQARSLSRKTRTTIHHILQHQPINSVMYFLSTISSVVPVDSTSERS